MCPLLLTDSTTVPSWEKKKKCNCHSSENKDPVTHINNCRERGQCWNRTFFTITSLVWMPKIYKQMFEAKGTGGSFEHHDLPPNASVNASWMSKETHDWFITGSSKTWDRMPQLTSDRKDTLCLTSGRCCLNNLVPV